MDTYLMPAEFGQAEITEKKSRFISRVWPVFMEDEALERIKDIRSRYPDAAHNVYAYIIRDGSCMRCSDDGEPGGTSGMPTLNVFRGGDIQNVCCVTTRYFGGTLLGAGGLVRAYSAAAKLALDAAGICRMALWRSYIMSCAYSQYERLTRLLEDCAAVTESTDFGVDVVIEACLRDDCAGGFLESLRNITNGTVAAEETGLSFRGVRL